MLNIFKIIFLGSAILVNPHRATYTQAPAIHETFNHSRHNDRKTGRLIDEAFQYYSQRDVQKSKEKVAELLAYAYTTKLPFNITHALYLQILFKHTFKDLSYITDLNEIDRYLDLLKDDEACYKKKNQRVLLPMYIFLTSLNQGLSLSGPHEALQKRYEDSKFIVTYKDLVVFEFEKSMNNTLEIINLNDKIGEGIGQYYMRHSKYLTFAETSLNTFDPSAMDYVFVHNLILYHFLKGDFFYHLNANIINVERIQSRWTTDIMHRTEQDLERNNDLLNKKYNPLYQTYTWMMSSLDTALLSYKNAEDLIRKYNPNSVIQLGKVLQNQCNTYVEKLLMHIGLRKCENAIELFLNIKLTPGDTLYLVNGWDVKASIYAAIGYQEKARVCNIRSCLLNKSLNRGHKCKKEIIAFMQDKQQYRSLYQLGSTDNLAFTLQQLMYQDVLQPINQELSKKKCQKTLGQYSTQAYVTTILKKNEIYSPEALEAALQLVFEAISQGIMAQQGKKKYQCLKKFLKQNPSLVNMIAIHHPRYFVDARILKKCKTYIKDPAVYNRILHPTKKNTPRHNEL